MRRQATRQRPTFAERRPILDAALAAGLIIITVIACALIVQGGIHG